MAQVNIQQLFEDKQEQLALSWVAGANGAAKILDSDLVSASNKGLIGHLNFIHPNWVQVLSETEVDHLQGLPSVAVTEALAQLERGGTLCLIVAGTEKIPQELIVYANRTHTPLFRSPLPSVHLMWLVRHYIVKALAESTVRHGVFLDVLGVGVLVTGDSGIGKSELGLELITRGNGLVADDITELYRISPETLEGRCPELLRDFLEVRGLGVLNIRTMFGETAVRRKKSLKLIVHLQRPLRGDLSHLERLPLAASHQEILGVKISTVSIPVMAAANAGSINHATISDQRPLRFGEKRGAQGAGRQRLLLC